MWCSVRPPHQHLLCFCAAFPVIRPKRSQSATQIQPTRWSAWPCSSLASSWVIIQKHFIHKVNPAFSHVLVCSWVWAVFFYLNKQHRTSNVQCVALYLFYHTHFGHLMKETVPDLAKSQWRSVQCFLTYPTVVWTQTACEKSKRIHISALPAVVFSQDSFVYFVFLTPWLFIFLFLFYF